MKIEVHFYKKDQVAVNIATEKIFGEHDHELLMYAWFTLRQLHNQGHHTASDAFAGLLTRAGIDPQLVSFETASTLPKGGDLLLWALDARFPSGDSSEEKRLAELQFLRQSATPSSNEHIYANLIEQVLLAKVPHLIEFPGRDGDKRFIGTLPPPNFQYKGFGFFGNSVGKDIPYFAFHSLLATLNYFVKRYSEDRQRLDRLTYIADGCGRAHMANLIKPGGI